MNALSWLFLAFLVAGLFGQLYLARRQRRYVLAHAHDIPPAFAADVGEAEHKKAVDYTVAKLQLERVRLLLGAVVLVFWTLGGGIAWLDRTLAELGLGALWGGTILVVGVFLLSALVELPLDAWRTFGVETAFGFNRTSPARFAADRLLGLLVSIVLGGGLLLGVLWLMGRLDDWWWLAVWALWMAFSLTVTWAYPRFIAPLFNRFSPLTDGELRERLEGLLARCGFRSSGVFVMDGSRRSSHGNAYFTGFGKNKRIVFFDTLIERLDAPELEAVLAHELGHFRKRHVQKGLVLMAVMSLGGLALLGWMADQPWFYAAFGISQPGPAVALLLFLLLAPVFMEWTQPLFAALSRRHEFEADAFAAAHTDAGAMVTGLTKLYRDNASVLVSDPLYSAYHYSHPPPAERVARLAEFRL